MRANSRSTIQIWPVNDPFFGKYLADELSRAFRQNDWKTSKLEFTKNGSRISRFGKRDQEISIELSKHRFRFTADRKKERFMNVHLPDGIDPDKVFEVIDKTARRYMVDHPNYGVDFLNISLHSQGNNTAARIGAVALGQPIREIELH